MTVPSESLATAVISMGVCVLQYGTIGFTEDDGGTSATTVSENVVEWEVPSAPVAVIVIVYELGGVVLLVETVIVDVKGGVPEGGEKLTLPGAPFALRVTKKS